MKLSGAERHRLVELVASTCGDTEDLRVLVEHHAPELSSLIQWKQALRHVVHQVIERAEQHGATSEILFALAKERPNRPDVMSLVVELCRGQTGR